MAFKRFPFQLNEEFVGMPVVFIKTYSGLLSGCQIALIRKKMVKYAGQLTQIANKEV